MGVEFLYVDDGSTDGSSELLAALAKRDHRIRVLPLAANRGQSAAMAAGFRASRGDWVATLDADGQNDPADLPKLLARTGEAEVVNGVRADRQDSWVRKLSSKIGNGFRNWATGENVTDVGCSLRVMRGDLVRELKLYRGLHRFLPTLLRMEGGPRDRGAGAPPRPPSRRVEVRDRQPPLRRSRRRLRGALGCSRAISTFVCAKTKGGDPPA